MLIAALRQSTGDYGQALYVIAVLMFLSTAIPLSLRSNDSRTPQPSLAR
jgi:hypothetical protein